MTGKQEVMILENMEYANRSETDVAHDILSEKNEAMYYKELVMEVIDKKRKPVQSLAQAISEVYTLINMDSRFHYEGEGKWGLTEWNPPEVKRTHTTRAGVAAGSKTSRRREKLLEGIQEE